MTQALQFSRDGIVLTAYDVHSIAPHISVEVARRRLRKWEKLSIDCDELFKLQRLGNTSQKYSLLAIACKDLGPRKDINEIKISKFERELVKQLDQGRDYDGLERCSKTRPTRRVESTDQTLRRRG